MVRVSHALSDSADAEPERRHEPVPIDEILRTIDAASEMLLGR